ncbi:MAG: M23 family metallopeptidase [Bacteroidota bacterium]|nr:M23 family metallopeptidase [Bacteroidota bacterium]
MTEKTKKEWWQRFLTVYRVVIYKHSTLEERASLTLTPINLLMLMSILVTVFFLICYLLLAFTPLKYAIPAVNEAKYASPDEIIILAQRADSLESIILSRENELKSLKRVLMGQDSAGAYINTSPHQVQKVYNYQEGIKFYTAFQKESVSTGHSYTKPPLFFPPVQGYLSQGFNPVEDHYGIDVVSFMNAPVKATLDGVVVFSEWTSNTGNVMILQHGSSFISIYRHNSVLLKKVGSFVQAGEVIALVGNSGELTTGPHLHFELWHRGMALNPGDVIAF